MEKSKKTYKLTLSAVFVALASVLSLVKVYKLPLGGSVTLFSMVPIILIGLFLGLSWGMASSFCYSLIQLFFGIVIDGVLGWGLTPLSLIGTIFLDYVLPFTLLGLVALCRKSGPVGVGIGVAVVMALRFVCHFVSGVIIFDIWCEWKSVPLYSLCYNGSFMLPELVITAIAVIVILSLPQTKRLFQKIDL